MIRERPGKKPSGFTLMEGLFSLFIVFLVLSGLSSTLGQAAQVKKNTRNMDQAIEESHALLTMESDIMAALSVSAPSSGASSEQLVLSRVDPRLSFYDRTDVIGDPLNSFETAEQIGVRYVVDGGFLKRFVSKPGGETTAERLIAAEKLEVSMNTAVSKLVTVELSVKGTRVIKKRLLKVAAFSL